MDTSSTVIFCSGVYICGHSAGGHLTAMMLSVEWMSECMLSSSIIKGIRHYLHFYYYQWIDTCPGGLLIPKGLIRPVVRASALTWFSRYLFFIGIYTS